MYRINSNKLCNEEDLGFHQGSKRMETSIMCPIEGCLKTYPNNSLLAASLEMRTMRTLFDQRASRINSYFLRTEVVHRPTLICRSFLNFYVDSSRNSRELCWMEKPRKWRSIPHPRLRSNLSTWHWIFWQLNKAATVSATVPPGTNCSSPPPCSFLLWHFPVVWGNCLCRRLLFTLSLSGLLPVLVCASFPGFN